MKNTKRFVLKNINIDVCILTKEQDSKNFLMVALDGNKQVGYCSFFFENSSCKINRIAITNKDFLGKGIGTTMFNAMEQFAHKNDIKYLEGLFIPRGYDDAWQRTAKFYERHDMKTFENDFDYGDRQEISKHVENLGEEYDVPVVVNKLAFEEIDHYNNFVKDLFCSTSKDSKAENPEIEL